ncbi:MAG: hypothetical protein R3Y40_08910 [Eubacteriales bacterium]
MCELFDDIREEGRVEGEERSAKAIVNSLRRFNATTEEILEELMRGLGFQEEDARKFL